MFRSAYLQKHNPLSCSHSIPIEFFLFYIMILFVKSQVFVTCFLPSESIIRFKNCLTLSYLTIIIFQQYMSVLYYNSLWNFLKCWNNPTIQWVTYSQLVNINLLYMLPQEKGSGPSFLHLLWDIVSISIKKEILNFFYFLYTVLWFKRLNSGLYLLLRSYGFSFQVFTHSFTILTFHLV